MSDSAPRFKTTLSSSCLGHPDGGFHHRQDRPRRVVLSRQRHFSTAGGDHHDRRRIAAPGDTFRQGDEEPGARGRRGWRLCFLAASVLAWPRRFSEAGDSALLFNIFIFIPSVFGIMFASLWLLASDIFETTPKPEAARAFSKIGASSLSRRHDRRLHRQGTRPDYSNRNG